VNSTWFDRFLQRRVAPYVMEYENPYQSAGKIAEVSVFSRRRSGIHRVGSSLLQVGVHVRSRLLAVRSILARLPSFSSHVLADFGEAIEIIVVFITHYYE